MGRRVIYFAAAAAAIAAALLPGTAKAADPAICGTTITASVTLTGDTNCNATNADAIMIGASGVTLNLGGYTLTSYSGDTAIKIKAGLSNVTIENGTIAAGAWDGIHDLGHQTNLTIENLTITSPDYRGISLHDDAGALIQNNTITGAGEYGIYSYVGAGNGYFSNTVTDSSDTNMYIEYDQGSAVEGNSATVTGDTPETAWNFYDYESDMNLWYGNLATGGSTGFVFEGDAYGTVTALNNAARGWTGPADTTEWNGFGFVVYEEYAGTGNAAPGPTTLISGNIATGGINGGSGYYTYFNPGDMFTGNTANRNDGDGFYIDEPFRETVTSNNGSFNNGDGFYVDSYGDEGAPTSFANNTAWYNQNYGFEAEYATVGSGNTGMNGAVATNNGGDCYAMTGCN